MSRLYFYAKVAFAWMFVLIAMLILASETFPRTRSGIFLLWLVLMIFVMTSAVVHVRRVKLVNGTLNSATLANRQRRQIEMPMGTEHAFDVVDASIREIPGVQDVQSARATLQVSAKVLRQYPSPAVPLLQSMLGWFGVPHNRVFATVAPRGESSTVTLVSEPEGGVWRDWFTVDNGTNLENADAVSRAISRRISEARRGEQAATQETATEKELAVARLALLHAQVEPHFLYNTLGSAKYLVRSDPDGAERIIDNLILYLRHSLPRLDDAISMLGEEVERVRAYLEIMQIRMGARLRTELGVPDALKAVPFPSMMLQTLVENAIKHGLEPKSGGGTVWIMAADKGDRVAITVADDGIGFGSATAGSGIGLKNLRERLKLAYGPDASFDIASNFPSGVAATITVPKAGPRHTSGT
ncbi:MAG: histidine kinase [Burkholderiales bacterium]